MLDLNYVREHLEQVRAALQKRGVDAAALDDFIENDNERRREITNSEKYKAEITAASRQIGGLMKDGRHEEAEARRNEVRDLKTHLAAFARTLPGIETRLNDLLSTLPNIPHESVPVGADESANVEVRRWGKKPEFEFEVRDHVDLGTSLGILDLDRAAKIAASRFAILNGAGARLERALVNFMLDVQTR